MPFIPGADVAVGELLSRLASSVPADVQAALAELRDKFGIGATGVFDSGQDEWARLLAAGVCYYAGAYQGTAGGVRNWVQVYNPKGSGVRGLVFVADAIPDAATGINLELRPVNGNNAGGKRVSASGNKTPSQLVLNVNNAANFNDDNAIVGLIVRAGTADFRAPRPQSALYVLPETWGLTIDHRDPGKGMHYHFAWAEVAT